jgi:hypothetical protein
MNAIRGLDWTILKKASEVAAQTGVLHPKSIETPKRVQKNPPVEMI